MVFVIYVVGSRDMMKDEILFVRLCGVGLEFWEGYDKKSYFFFLKCY